MITNLLIKAQIHVFNSLIILRDISLRCGTVCPLLDNMNTWFFHRSSFPVIISLSMLLVTIILLFWYSPLQRVQIHWRLRFQIRRWLIIWEMICWRQWNEKMVRCMMTLIIAVGGSMKQMMTLILCLIPLNKILEVNHIYGYLAQPMTKEILWRVTIFFISHRMDGRGGLFRAKGRWLEGKISFKGN